MKYILWSVKEHINDHVSAFDVVEEYKKTPMNEPSALLEYLQWIELTNIIIDIISKFVNVFKRCVPILRKNFWGQFSPWCIQIVL